MDKDKQMQFLFEEGGIADDGMNRDPISGNEIPPGSLAEEVRDDIPAQLSEGEYVVPADVLRYYGVKFFEDLRTQAKMGLGEMEQDGRIGGEPIPADQVIDSELSPEEEAELQAMMGMAVGGFVTEQPTQATDPYMAQAQLYRAPAPVAVGNTMEQRGFQEGGLTEADTQAGFNPRQFAAGFSFAQPRQRQETVAVTLYGPAGDIVSLILPADEVRYEQLLAEGYTTERAPTAQVTSEITGGEGDDSLDGGGRDDFLGGDDVDRRDLSELSVDELQANLDGLNTMSRIGGALVGAVNPLFGMATRAALNANRANIVKELENRGVDMSGYRDENGRDIYGGGLSLYDGLQDQPGSKAGVDFGDTWLGDVLGFDGKAGVQGPSLAESRAGARRDFSGGSTAPASTGPTNNQGGSDDNRDGSNAVDGGGGGNLGGGGAGSDNLGGGSTGGRGGGTASPGATGAGAPGGGGSAKGAGPGGKDAVGPMNQGGFVSRRNKNKK